MLKNGELLFDFKERIKSKYGYDEDFAETICTVASSLADYLPPEYEQTVFNSVESCRFTVARGLNRKDRVQESCLDCLEREGMSDGISREDPSLKRAEGLYVSVPEISYEDGTYRVEDIRRMIVLNNRFDGNNIGSIGTLTREMLHLTKSYINEYSIEGNVLTSRSGLKTSKDSLSQKDGKITRTPVEQYGQGLQQGLDVYDELCIMRDYDAGYETRGYDNQRLVAGYLMDEQSVALRDEITLASMLKDDAHLRELFDAQLKEGYEGFLRVMDESLELEQRRFRAIGEEHALLSAEADRHYEEVVCPLIRQMNTSLNVERGIEHGYRKGA